MTVPVVLLTVVNVVLSIMVGMAGRRRKFGFWGYFFASLAFTAFIGILLVLASDAHPELPAKGNPS